MAEAARATKTAPSPATPARGPSPSATRARLGPALVVMKAPPAVTVSTPAGKGGGAKGPKLKMPEPPADLTPAGRRRLERVKGAAAHAASAEAALPPASDHVADARGAVTP